MLGADEEDRIVDAGLWSFLVSQKAFSSEVSSERIAEGYAIDQLGLLELVNGSAVGRVVHRLRSLVGSPDEKITLKSSSKAQDRVFNWTWIGNSLEVLRGLGVKPLDAQTKMLAVSGDIDTILSLMMDLKISSERASSKEIVGLPRLSDTTSRHLKPKNSNRKSRSCSPSRASSQSSVEPMKPVISPVSAVRIDRLRQILLDVLQPCLPHPDAAADLLPTADDWRKQSKHEPLRRAVEGKDRDLGVYPSILAKWVDLLLRQSHDGSLTCLEAAISNTKDNETLRYLLHVLVPCLRSTHKPLAVGGARALCTLAAKIAPDLNEELWLWFFDVNGNSATPAGLPILLDSFKIHGQSMRMTLFRVLLAVAGDKVVSALVTSLPLILGLQHNDQGSFLLFASEVVPLLMTNDVRPEHRSEIYNEYLKAGFEHTRNDTPSEVLMPALQLITSLWVVMPSLLPDGSPRANAALDALRSASKPHKEQAVGTRMEALSCLFQLLHRLTEARHRCAVIVYKSLVFALVETHVGVVEGDKGSDVIHEFLQSNLLDATRRIPSLPVHVMIEPLINQHARQGYNNNDLGFLACLASHPRLAARQALLLLHFTAKVAVHDVVFGRLAGTISIELLSRFKDQSSFLAYLEKFTRVAFSLFMKASERRYLPPNDPSSAPDPGLKVTAKSSLEDAESRSSLALEMLSRVWMVVQDIPAFTSKISILARSVVSDFKTFFPTKTVPIILRRYACENLPAPEAKGAPLRPNFANPAPKPSVSHIDHRKSPNKSSSYPKKHGKSRQKYHPSASPNVQRSLGGGYANRAKPSQTPQLQRKTAGPRGGMAVKLPAVQSPKTREKVAKRQQQKRAMMEARLGVRRKEVKELLGRRKELAERDVEIEIEREREKELRRAKIEHQTRKRIEKLKKERMREQETRKIQHGLTTPGGSPVAPQGEWTGTDKTIWSAYKTQCRRLVRTYAGTRPDPVARNTFSDFSKAVHTLSLAEFLKFCNDVRLSPHYMARRVLSQMYRILAGSDQAFGPRQLCAAFRLLATHDRMAGLISSQLKEKEKMGLVIQEAKRGEQEATTRVLLEYIKQTWIRCKYTPHNLWEPMVVRNKRSSRQNSVDLRRRQRAAELTAQLRSNPSTELPRGFEIHSVWPEAYAVAHQTLRKVLTNSVSLSNPNFGSPPPHVTEARVVWVGLDEGAEGRNCGKGVYGKVSNKVKYDPGRKRRELEEKKKRLAQINERRGHLEGG